MAIKVKKKVRKAVSRTVTSLLPGTYRHCPVGNNKYAKYYLVPPCLVVTGKEKDLMAIKEFMEKIRSEDKGNS